MRRHTHATGARAVAGRNHEGRKVGIIAATVVTVVFWTTVVLLVRSGAVL